MAMRTPAPTKKGSYALTDIEETDDELLERYQDVRLDHVNKHFYHGLLHQELD